MASWIEGFRLIGTLVVLGLVGIVIAVALIFEAPSNWPGARRVARMLKLDRGGSV